MTRGLLMVCGALVLPAAAQSAVAADSFCEVTISGDENVKFRGTGDIPAGATAEQKAVAAKNVAGSDYWVADEDLKRALASIVKSENLGKTLTPDELNKKVAARMAADPRTTPLNVACGNKDIGVVVMASPKSKYATVPQKAGKYRIVGEREAKPGDFTLLFLSGPTMYELAAPGALELTRFDASGVAGKFSFEAVPSFSPKGKRVKVAATFSYPCQGRGRCKP